MSVNNAETQFDHSSILLQLDPSSVTSSVNSDVNSYVNPEVNPTGPNSDTFFGKGGSVDKLNNTDSCSESFEKLI